MEQDLDRHDEQVMQQRMRGSLSRWNDHQINHALDSVYETLHPPAPNYHVSHFPDNTRYTDSSFVETTNSPSTKVQLNTHSMSSFGSITLSEQDRQVLQLALQDQPKSQKATTALVFPKRSQFLQRIPRLSNDYSR
jgi:hypothetical protein